MAAVVGALVGATLWLLPLGIAAPAQRATSVAVATIVWWAASVIEPAWAGAFALLLFWTAGVSTSTVLSGFVNSTIAFLVGALLIGLAAADSGLARRLALALAARLGRSYSGLLLAFVTADLLLTFLIPSGIARVALLGAVVAGLLQSLGVARSALPARGLMLAVTCAASIFDKMVLAGTSSILASGIIEELSGIRVSYAQWFLAYLPCDVLTVLACWRLMAWLFPDRDGVFDGCADLVRAQRDALGPWSAAERRTAVLVAAAIGVWLTEAWHGVRPSTAALVIGAATLLPGPGSGASPWRRAMRLPVRTLVFTASALGMSAALAEAGALPYLTRGLVAWMAPLVDSRVSAAVVLYWGAFVYHLLLGAQNLLVTATLPAIVTLGLAEGHNPATLGMIWLFGTAGKIFPYQSGVLMVGYSFGSFTARDLIRAGLLLAVVESILLLLTVAFYWPLVGLG